MNCKKTTTLLNFKKEEREREKGNTVKNTYEPFRIFLGTHIYNIYIYIYKCILRVYVLVMIHTHTHTAHFSLFKLSSLYTYHLMKASSFLFSFHFYSLLL